MMVYLIFSQDYIARFGHGSAKLARQAQSKEKVLAKMVDKGKLTEWFEIIWIPNVLHHP